MLTKNGLPVMPKRLYKRLAWNEYRWLPTITPQTAYRYQRRFGGSVCEEGIMRTVTICNRDSNDKEYPVARVNVPSVATFYKGQ